MSEDEEQDPSSYSTHTDGLNQDWACDFHGISYIVSVEVYGAVLRVVAEETETNDRWKGEFSSQYIEEITQKAGNYKKFPVFVRMMGSALSRDSDSVFVDLLTYADLELLKARKTGSVNHSASVPARSQSKRYMILTYSGEFDRVHFPLPLTFEEEPDVAALQRTIARLKRAMLDKTTEQLDEGQRDDSHTSASQLRRENMELRHRLRNFEGRTLPSGTGAASASSVAASQQNGELLLAYSKLKRQCEATKKELHAATLAYERLRTDSAKEITKLKIQLVGDSNPKLNTMDNIELSKKLKAQCAQLKKELDTERMEHKRCIARHQRELANLRHHSSTYPRRSASPSPGANAGSSARSTRSRSSAAGSLPPRPSSAGSSRGNSSHSAHRTDVTPTAPTRRGGVSGDSSTQRRSSSHLYGHGNQQGSRAGTNSRPSEDRYSRTASRSPSPIIERPPWNAGSRKNTNAGYESGYSSAASAGSRHSRTSQVSRSSQLSRGTNASTRSGGAGEPKKSKKRTVPKSPISEDSDVPYYSNEDANVRKRKPVKKSKHKDTKKKKASRDPMDYDILGPEPRGNQINSSAPPPRVAASPPREITRRSRDPDHAPSRDQLRNSRDSAAADSTIMAVRRSDDSRASRGTRDSRSRRDGDVYLSASLQENVLGTSAMKSARLDPNDFPVSTPRNYVEESGQADAGDVHEDDEAMRHAFDGLQLRKRESISNDLRRSHESHASVTEVRRSRESERGVQSISSKAVVITRAGPPRGERDNSSGSSRRQQQAQSSDSEEENGIRGGGDNDISEIDKRIKALQSFLDKARSGIIGEGEDDGHQ